MHRRQLLGSLPLALLTGCVSNTRSPGEHGDTRVTEQTRAGTFTAEIVDVRYHKQRTDDHPTPPKGNDGNYQETVTASTDCGANTATLAGWLFTSSCRTATIKSVSYDGDTDHLTLVLYPAWDNQKPPAAIDCAGAKYYYQIRLEAERALPGAISVRYQWPGGRGPLRFTLPINC